MNQPRVRAGATDAVVPAGKDRGFRVRSLPWRRQPLASALLFCRELVLRLPLLSGLLLWMSFPPVGYGWVAWFALLPLASLIRQPWRGRHVESAADQNAIGARHPAPARPIYRPAWLGGLVFGLLSVQWIRYADDSGPTGYYGWWALGAYISLYFPMFLFIARIAVLRFRIPIILAVPTVWIGLEYLRSGFLTGFPWYYLAHSQYSAIHLIQIADVTGSYGVGFLVAMVNGWILDLGAVPLVRPSQQGIRIEPRQVWRFGLMAAALGTSLAYGSWRLKEVEPEPGPRVALMQSSIPQMVKEDEARIPDIHQSYWDQLAEAVPQRPQLVIWPETAYRYPLPLIAPDLTDAELIGLLPGAELEPEEIHAFARHVKQSLMAYASRSGTPVLMGINTERLERTGSRRYNTAYLVHPNGELSEPYNKIHLVPWGEYLPLRQWMPWLRIFTPHASSDYGLQAGDGPVRFQLGQWSFGVLICFEDTLPWAARAYTATVPVDVLVSISNDGWFGVVAEGEAEASIWRRAEHESHFAISVFRAVECRRPLVRAVNTGVSAIVDSCGRIVRSSGESANRSSLSSQVIVGEVPLDHRRSLYTQTGDWLGVSSFALTAMAVVVRLILAVFRRRTA